MLIYDENQDKLYSIICNHLTIYFCGGIYSIPFYTSIFFMSDRVYIAIDQKSFYASVECIERGLDLLTTNLVVADKSRSEKTICLAISHPSRHMEFLDAHGFLKSSSGCVRLIFTVAGNVCAAYGKEKF